MLSRSRAFAVLALSPLFLWSCTDADVVGPEADMPIEAFDGFGASVVLDEVAGFYFLTPLADGNPKIDGEFNPNFSPELRVCEIVGTPNATAGCEGNPVTTLFEAGEADVNPGSEQYGWSWDTDAGRSPRFKTNSYYQLQVAVGDVV
ncbi:MAG TPA: hypothetical protein VJ925_14425, partial [Longimicrobiales bacterium]|nr:hypothetical protein [Longimicrobiales bacterium]